jgi:hypothetical protein
MKLETSAGSRVKPGMTALGPEWLFCLTCNVQLATRNRLFILQPATRNSQQFF